MSGHYLHKIICILPLWFAAFTSRYSPKWNEVILHRRKCRKHPVEVFIGSSQTEHYHDEHQWETREHRWLCIHIVAAPWLSKAFLKPAAGRNVNGTGAKEARSKSYRLHESMQRWKPQKRARAETRAAVVLGIKCCWWRQKQEDLWGAIEMSYVDASAVVLAVKCQPGLLQLIEIWAWCRVFHLLMHDFICKKYSEPQEAAPSWTQPSRSIKSLTHTIPRTWARTLCSPMLLWNNHPFSAHFLVRQKRVFFKVK